MRIAFVHDWLITPGGSEKVLEAMLAFFPGATVYTLIYDEKAFRQSPIARHPIRTSFLQGLPWRRIGHQVFLPLMPLAIETFDLSGYDLVVSSSHAVAKGVIAPPGALHLAYVHSPMRYAWDLKGEYLKGFGRVKAFFAEALLHYLRLWDVSSAARVDHFLANSHHVARRIARAYRREARVLYPPVDVERFDWRKPREEFYLVVARLVPYKRVDLIVKAFNLLRRPLLVIGDGPEMAKIARLAGPNVRLLGRQPDELVRDLMARAKAFVYMAEEDFGIAPVEALAAGSPVVAYGRGGVGETVLHGETGWLFYEQRVEALVEAVEAFERLGTISPEVCRKRAEAFSLGEFRKNFLMILEEVGIRP
ncbi:glycosyltransferase [Thermus oshimai JL-2]|uniref:Glycosyltransferase n=1 Tax=Thermus oshimai JL-2 TaxID=751945 RepID=K7QVX5_THEOS|nr:glycosyltransferase [Thermus oshimai]AFV75543.1 glycosyltransferase [Thermus oshimai JL-2]